MKTKELKQTVMRNFKISLTSVLFIYCLLPTCSNAAAAGDDIVIATGQEYKKTLKEANKAFKVEDYGSAIELYKSVISLSSATLPSNGAIYLNLGISQMKLHKYRDAIRNFATALEVGKEYFWGKEVDEIKGFKVWCERKRVNAQVSETLYENPLDVEIINVKSKINTVKYEFVPSYTGDGKWAYFYKYIDPARAKKINGYGGGGDIYAARIVRGAEVDEQKLPAHINTEYWEGHAFVTPDGNSLYFASNRPGGFGGMDIYVSKKNAVGDWLEPQNLGSPINSQYNEITPSFHPDGKRLYFSSKGYPGMGGHDIFQSILGQDGKWSKPINMGHPINDAEDDYHFRVSSSADTAWFSSLRDGSSEKRNVYIIPNIPDETELVALEELLDEAYKYKVEFETATHETATLNEEEELALEKLLFEAETLSKQEKLELEKKLDGAYKYKAGVETAALNEKEEEAEKGVKPEEEDYVKDRQITASLSASLLASIENNINRNIESKQNISTIENMEGLEFKIQIGAYRNRLSSNSTMFDKVNDVEHKKFDDQIIRYTTGAFDNLQKALVYKKLVRSIGFDDAFIAFYYQGERISLSHSRL